ncbi:hypothetical protein M011DRAFT_497116 [Sporormia fimetaria CBS 119925]|uniref:Uncharacterized protein n=1 Tax=Sporormia fimetaria CBS 119925 TaxID=1340428 RepID=A0A6A6UXW8_9PLEO|nr:hypothetical protein M011DRAFT_497116 [Sporormia fimetaria CBS 119925]
MGKVFFNDWALWQKMTFVLACLIVITILIGLAKLQYDRVHLRKYAKVEKGKQAQTPEMMEAQPISEEEKEDIPFGIRAIESGIEVDGVWISRSNTPVGSSRSSITDVKLSRSHNNSQLELPKAIHGSSSRSSLASSFDRAVSAERLMTNQSRSSSPGHENARTRPPVASSSRYSNTNLSRNSATLQALEGPQDPASISAKTGQSSSRSRQSSARTSDETDYMTIPEGRPYEAAYLNPIPKHAPLSVPNDPRTDLDLLQTHRLSHVAETGQLTPRVRRPGHSGEWASVADNVRAPHEISNTNGVDFFVPQQKTPSPPPNPLAGPPLDAVDPRPADQYPAGQYPESHSGQRQAAPLLETYATQARQAPESYQPRGPDYEPEEALHSEPQSGQSSQRQSQVLRKVNSGFEILRPGTLGEPPSPEEDRTPTGEKRRSKKLQKRRTSSSASRPSQFIEQGV